MSMGFFWRRVPAALTAEASPKELYALVPKWFGEEFAELARNGLATGTQNNGYLMNLVLTTAEPVVGETSELPVYGGELRVEGEEDPEYGFMGVEVLVLGPEQVQQAAAFLRGAPVRDWVARADTALAQEVVGLGFSTPWSQEWAEALTANLVALQALFEAAAAAGDGVLKVDSS
jgi:hypothetical protein